MHINQCLYAVLFTVGVYVLMQQVQQQGYNLQTWKYSHEIVLFYVFDVNILWLSVLMHIAFFLMETISEYQKLGVINFVLTLYKKLLF